MEQAYTNEREALVRRIEAVIDNVGCIYPSVGAAMYDEPKQRIAYRVADLLASALSAKDAEAKAMKRQIQAVKDRCMFECEFMPSDHIDSMVQSAYKGVLSMLIDKALSPSPAAKEQA
jgi:hypothetical protein